jgi:hypothetical protein
MATKRNQQGTYRKTSIVVGVLFIIGTVAGVFSGIVTGPVLDAPDYLAQVAANERSMVLGAILVLVMGFPLAMIPAMMFPIFRQYNEPLALGAVIFRGVLEAVTYIVLATCWLLLISVGQASVSTGAADAATFQAMGTFIKQAGYWTEHILALVFTIGALMLYWLFFKTKLIPNWLALWGFFGAILYFAAPIFNLFDPSHPALSLGVKWGNLMAPLAIQEMVFALWMIIKGFNSAAIEQK